MTASREWLVKTQYQLIVKYQGTLWQIVGFYDTEAEAFTILRELTSIRDWRVIEVTAHI